MRRVVSTIVTVALGVIAGCAYAGPLKPSELQGSWTLVEVNSQPVTSRTPDALPNFTIKNESIEGFDGCNSFSGRLDRPGSITSTRRGCAGDVVKLPLDLADPLAHLKEGRIEKDTLILPARQDMPASVFKRVVAP